VAVERPSPAADRDEPASRPSETRTPPPDRRPVHVRIGTIEIKVSTPPTQAPSAPAPAGFEEYESIRNYRYWNESF
jgi:hypothetical protein